MAGGPRLFRIDEPFEGRLAVSQRPQGWDALEGDVIGWRDAGVDAVVSMMQPDEAEEFGLSAQELFCREHGVEMIRCPVSDHGIPEDREAVMAAVDRALALLSAGRSVAAHCFAGIGRSPLFVAAVLVRHGLEADVAWERINAARGLQLPETDAQWQWVAEFADSLRSG